MDIIEQENKRIEKQKIIEYLRSKDIGINLTKKGVNVKAYRGNRKSPYLGASTVIKTMQDAIKFIEEEYK